MTNKMDSLASTPLNNGADHKVENKILCISYRIFLATENNHPEILGAFPFQDSVAAG
jgi:hypothetical protein